MRIKSTMTLSFSHETKARLKAYAEQRHTTVSQAITDWIWAQPVKEDSHGDDRAKEGKDDD